MRSLFPSSYDRADVLMSAGCSTFVSAALILVIPRFGVLLLEILFGLFFIGCALMARARVRRRVLGKEGPKKSSDAKAKWFDRYDVLMILAVIVVQTAAGGIIAESRLVGRHCQYFAAHDVRGGDSAEATCGRIRRTPPENATGRRRLPEHSSSAGEPRSNRSCSRPGVSEISKERKKTSDVSQRNRNDCRVEGSSAASRQWKNDARGRGFQSDSSEGYDNTPPAGSPGQREDPREKNASSLPAEAVTETSRRSAASVLPKRKPSSMRFVNR